MSRFEECLKFTLPWEGGYVNNPYDSGGATNYGVTQETYNEYLMRHGKRSRDVRDITMEEISAIYREMYWDALDCDKLFVAPLDLVMFDTAVNFGVVGAVEFLQEALNVEVDGDFGPVTKQALGKASSVESAELICYGRLSYRDYRVMQKSSQHIFHSGWIRRDLALLDKVKPYNPRFNKMDVVETALAIAKLEQPVSGSSMETYGANAGPKVNRYLATAGYYPGVAWCSAFVYYCIKMACYRKGVDNIPFVPEGRCGYCPYVEQWARDMGVLYHNPKRGDAILLCDDISAYHIGFVLEVNGNQVITIEGNTNYAGSPEGIGIFIRRRYNNKYVRFVRWGELVLNTSTKKYKLYVSGEKVADCVLRNNRAYAPVRVMGEKLGYRVIWDQEKQAAYYDEYRVTNSDAMKIDGSLYAPVRDIVNSVDELGLFIMNNSDIYITKSS